MPSRRRVLGLTVATAVSAGCLSIPNSGKSNGPTETADSNKDIPQGAVRGEADPISVEKSVDDSRYKYIPSNSTLRYPPEGSKEESAYRYMPFEEWGHVEGASAAEATVEESINEGLSNTENITPGIYSGEDSELYIHVLLVTSINQEGTIQSKPETERSRVVSVVPEKVDVTIQVSGKTYMDTYPVYVLESEKQEL